VSVASPPTRDLPPLLPALAAIARSGMREAFAQRAFWVGRSLFLVLILIIFSSLWQAVEAEGRLTVLSAQELIWYLAVTEWIVMSIPFTHLAMESEVRSGEIAGVLARPVPWLAAKVAEGLGAMLVRVLALGATGFVAAYVLAGGLPREPLALLLVLPLGLLSTALGTLLYVWIGLSTFWLGDTAPVAWVIQKLLFLFGGMILPLALYPEPLRAISEATPFAAMLSGPGRIALGAPLSEAASTLALLLAWGAVLLLVLRFTWTRALRRLDGAGG
jgi:ABC-2 type transport system permease protein